MVELPSRFRVCTFREIRQKKKCTRKYFEKAVIKKLTLSLARKIHNNCYGRLSSKVLIGQGFSLAFVRNKKGGFL